MNGSFSAGATLSQRPVRRRPARAGRLVWSSRFCRDGLISGQLTETAYRRKGAYQRAPDPDASQLFSADAVEAKGFL
jgi:hypothetical protein